MKGEATREAGALINAVGYDLLPPDLPYLDQFRFAADAGFRSVEMRTVYHPEAAMEVKEASERSGVHIHSVLAFRNGRHAFYSGDRDDVDANVVAALTSIENAALWGADVVLLVPGLVDAHTTFEEASTRSRRVIRERLLPAAEARNVTLGIENVWRGFLLSPLDYARYIDDFESPRVRAYLDVGNAIFGFPEHWVRTCGARLVRLHIKDFRMSQSWGRFRFAKLGAGSIDWLRVRCALREVGFEGPATSTGVPFDFAIRWINRASRVLRRQFAGRTVEAALNVAGSLRRGLYASFLRDIALRFERFETLR